MKDNERALEQAKLQMRSIVEMVTALEGEDRDAAIDRISEDPLSVEVRSDWYCPGEHQPTPAEFKILLCTGGPAVQIRGELDEYKEPYRAWIEYQDWFTPWERLDSADTDEEALLSYCRQFYFGE